MKLMTIIQPIIQLVLAVLLSATTFVLGAMPLLWLRRSTGAFTYSALCFAVSLAGLAFTDAGLWAPFVLNALLIYFYVLFERLWSEVIKSSAVTILLTALTAFLSLTLWLRWNGLTISKVFREKAEDFATQIAAIQPAIKVNVEGLLPQLPSAFLIILSISLWISLLSEAPWVQRNSSKSLRMTRLQKFRLPDAYIWILLASVFFSFTDLNASALQMISSNVMNVSVILYFFQGVAIVGTFFSWQRMGQVWQLLVYAILLTHLFLAVALLGILDFWLDFRERMVKKSAHRTGEVEQ